jgi:hypothetical protein
LKKFQQIRWWFEKLPLWLKLILGITFVVLVLARLALPFVIKTYVNHKLSENKRYSGKIGDITVHLWRGAYRIHDVDIYKTSGNIHESLFQAVYIDLSIEWRQLLLHHVAVGDVTMLEPKVNFVQGPTENQSQTGSGGDWDQLLSKLFPFDINRLESRDGSIHFHNDNSKPKVDIYMNQLNLTATNLTNAENQKAELPALIEATAKTIGGGDVHAEVKLNPVATSPTFELTGTVSGMDLTAFNNFIQAYGGFNVGQGIFSLYTNVASKGGGYDGYVKVFFKNLHVFILEKEGKRDILQVFWDAVMGGVTAVLTNPNGNLAAKVPISGSYGKSHVGVWAAMGSVIQNAFFQALLPKFDKKITVKSVVKQPGVKGSHPNQLKATATPIPNPK